MKKRMFNYCGTVLLVSLLLLLVGCTENVETQTQDKNIETMEAVLQNCFTGPSDELKAMLEEEGFEELLKYEENLYKGYFANETSYHEFVNSYGSMLMIEPIRKDYHLKVKNIEYEKTESKEIIYNFSVELEYKKEDSEKSEVAIVTGQANLNEEHKIEDLLIHDKEFHKLFTN